MADETIAGRYRLLEPLASGAMSSVWLAEDEELGRRVAVKTLAPTADRARFEREARAVASLSHPNICRLYDYGEAGGRPYMVLEYLSGGTLEHRLRGGDPLPDAEAERIAAEIADGLAQAHARGLVHRDLKPANVLFDGEGRAKIADFGIARMGNDGLTETGTVLGTAAYISPEQAAGEPAGPASDVYSFGAILFRMLTGRLPFVAANAMELVRMHRDEPPPTVASLRPDAPARLAAVADAALVKPPHARPSDGSELLALLVGGGGAVAPAAETAATQVLRPAIVTRRRRPSAVAALAVLAVCLLGGGGAAAWLATRSDPGSTPRQPSDSPALPAVPAGSTDSFTFSSTGATSTAASTSTQTTPRATTAEASTTSAPAPAVPTPTTPTIASTTAPVLPGTATTYPATTASTEPTTSPGPTTAETFPTTTPAAPTTTGP